MRFHLRQVVLVKAIGIQGGDAELTVAARAIWKVSKDIFNITPKYIRQLSSIQNTIGIARGLNERIVSKLMQL